MSNSDPYSNRTVWLGFCFGRPKLTHLCQSDWAAQHTTDGSALAGMDMAMPGDNMGNGQFLWGQNLLNAVSSGAVPQSRLDDMVRRILASWYLLGQNEGYPSVGFSSWNGNGGPNVQGSHKTVARDIARDGIVLLKNVNGTLPLHKPSSLAIIGQDSIVNPSGANACTFSSTADPSMSSLADVKLNSKALIVAVILVTWLWAGEVAQRNFR